MNWLLFILGVRTFIPNNASTGFLYVGGPAVVLSLVAMAPDDGYLYAALKVLLFVLETNSTMEKEMNRIEGYQVCYITGVDPCHSLWVLSVTSSPCSYWPSCWRWRAAWSATDPFNWFCSSQLLRTWSPVPVTFRTRLHSRPCFVT